MPQDIIIEPGHNFPLRSHKNYIKKVYFHHYKFEKVESDIFILRNFKK